jgi:hypothetical protein
MKPKPQRRGVWTPIEIWNLAETGKVSFLELRYLHKVDGYVRSKSIGCFASSAHLAKELECAPETIRAMAIKLKKMGLLIETGYIKVRNQKIPMRETCWSRPFQEPFDRLKRQKEIRAFLRKQFKQKIRCRLYSPNEVWKDAVKVVTRKDAVTATRKDAVTATRNLGITQTNTNRTNGRLNSPLRGGKAALNGHAEPKESKARWNWTMATQLYKGSKQNGRLLERPNVFNESAAFTDLEGKLVKMNKAATIQEARSLIEKVLRDHLKHQGESHQPKADSAWEFNRKFVSLHDAYKRRRNLLKKTASTDPNKIGDDQQW